MSLGQRVMSHGCSYRGGALGEGVLVARVVEVVEVDGGVIVLVGGRKGGHLMQKGQARRMSKNLLVL
jgi:hypothetical protein